MNGFWEKTLFEGYDRYGDGGILVPNYFRDTQNSYVLRYAKKVYAIEYGGGCCVRCKMKHPIILEFHHKDPTKKMKQYRILLGVMLPIVPRRH